MEAIFTAIIKVTVVVQFETAVQVDFRSDASRSPTISSADQMWSAIPALTAGVVAPRGSGRAGAWECLLVKAW